MNCPTTATAKKKKSVLQHPLISRSSRIWFLHQSNAMSSIRRYLFCWTMPYIPDRSQDYKDLASERSKQDFLDHMSCFQWCLEQHTHPKKLLVLFFFNSTIFGVRTPRNWLNRLKNDQQLDVSRWQ